MRPALLATFSLLAAAAVPALAAVPIPPAPFEAPEFIGAPAIAQPVDAYDVPRHPFMAENGRSNMHDDAYATDAYASPGPLGRNLVVTSATYGIEECATVAFDRKGRLIGLCGGAEGPRLMMLDPSTLDVLAALPLPPRMPRQGTTPLNDICGGAYFYLDQNDRAVIATTNRQLWVVSQSESPAGPAFALDTTYDLTPHIGVTDCLIATLPDWSGRVWFLTAAALVGAIDVATGDVTLLNLPAPEIVANSFSVDETGGVFIVTDYALYRLDADATGTPVVTWREAYDRGSAVKPGQLSQGSGTTPTLLGDDLVAITDNADGRMNVEFYRRGATTKKDRFVCRAPVFADGRSATENSLVAVDADSVVVENNYGYVGPQATMFGATTAPGLARVDVVGNRCRVAWTSSEIAPTPVAKASWATGLLYTYTKPARADGVDAWYFTAIDLHTGRTAWSRLTGTHQGFNNHYASIYLGPDGAAYMPMFAGMVRLADGS